MFNIREVGIVTLPENVIYANSMKTLYSLAVICLIFTSLSAQRTPKNGLDLKIRIDGVADTVFYLAHYYGDKQYVDDTARLGKSGWYQFQADTLLPGGMYIVAGQKKVRYFELLLDKEQQISVETRFDDIVGSMKVKGTKDNTLLYNYIQFLSSKQKEVNRWQKCIERNGKESDSAVMCEKLISNADSIVRGYISRFVEDNKGTLVAAFVGAQSEPRIPEPPKKDDGTIDSLFAFNYYKSHYFDNMDLGDDRMVRTPLFHQKISQYFTKLVLQIPDSIEAEVNRLAPVVKKGRDTYRYFVWFLTNHTERSDIMGMDAAFVFMVDKFYANGDMDFWINKTVRENLVKKADKLRDILIGKTAPELLMLDTLMRPQSLHSLKAHYTILFFWDPECGHCRKEVPKVLELVHKMKPTYDIGVYAVCTDTNMREMKAYIKKNKMDFVNVNGPRAYTKFFKDLYDIYSTPVIYLLDEKKTILAKRLLSDQLEGFIERHARNEKHGLLEMDKEN